MMTAEKKGKPPARTTWFAESVLFPAAAFWGALAVPLSLYSMSGGSYGLPGLASAPLHAHELLFGYAMAVVAGFLLNRIDTARLVMLVILWLGGRVAHLSDPGSVVSIACNVGFAVWVAAISAPPFIKGAKKWRNRAIAPMIIGLALGVAALEWALSTGRGWVSFIVLEQCVLLFALLMMFFGGRVIAPAVAGAIERRGGRLESRVQPLIEGVLIALIAASLPLSLVPATRTVAGIALVAAGILVLTRLARWRMWLCWSRVDLLCLGVGYGWLGFGLLLTGVARAFDAGVTTADATHAVTVGALGTLTANMMLRTRRLHLRQDPAMPLACALLTLLMSLAAILRIAGVGQQSLWLAAASWSAALIMLSALLMRHRRLAVWARVV